MNESPNFSSILDKKPSEVKEPKPLPQGAYMSMVQGPYKVVKAKSSGNTGYEFTLALQQPISDVDQAMLSDAGGALGKNGRITFYNDYFLKLFLVDHLGIDPGEGAGEKTLGQMMSEAPGRSVIAHIINQPGDKDPSRLVWFVKETSRA